VLIPPPPLGAEDLSQSQDDEIASEEIVTASGKMMMLDRLLPELQANNHRVVLFSQYTKTLDIIQDYLLMRGYEFARLDGSTHRVNREVRITQFNKPKSNTFIFILSTRAGGEGVNLYTADTVILFDSDWNPQVLI
jgi:SWI/SNF-related matrix-associated actin-dependent regulator of chromatin subfamily A member 5